MLILISVAKLLVKVVEALKYTPFFILQKYQFVSSHFQMQFASDDK